VKIRKLEYTTPQKETDKMPREERTFTYEFKLEAVHLVETSDKSISQVVRDLG
jgi:transposase-like protein